jgi:hypothetical protein
VPQFGRLDIPAHLHSVTKPHAQPLDRLHFFEAHLGSHLIDRDAVGVEATAGRLLVVDRDGVAQPGEFCGAAESGGACPEDGNPPTAGCGRLGKQVEAVGDRVVGGMPLQPPDLNRLLFEVEHHTCSLAEHRSRADPRTTPPEHVGLEDRASRPRQIVGGDLANKGGDVDPGRAGLDARGVEAEQTAASLSPGLLRRKGGLLLRQGGGEGRGAEEGLEWHGARFAGRCETRPQ